MKERASAPVLGQGWAGSWRGGEPKGPERFSILWPLLANIALSVLDEHFTARWKALGPAWTRAKRRRSGVPAFRLVRYADDFVVMVGGHP